MGLTIHIYRFVTKVETCNILIDAVARSAARALSNASEAYHVF